MEPEMPGKSDDYCSIVRSSDPAIAALSLLARTKPSPTQLGQAWSVYRPGPSVDLLFKHGYIFLLNRDNPGS